MNLRIAAARVTPYRLPLHSPVAGLTERSGWWIQVVDDAGRVGVGEAACWPGFGSNEAVVQESLQKILENLPRLRDAHSVLKFTAGCPEARFAFELALLDLAAQSQRLPLAQYLSPTAKMRVPVNALANTPADAVAAVAAGYTTLKVKLPNGDVPRVASIRDAVGPEVTLRIDANRGWPADRWRTIADTVISLGVELIEEPCADWGPVERVASVSLAADESVTDRASLERVIADDIADTVVLKPMFTGLLEAMELGRRAKQAGLKVIITHAMDSTVGRAGAAHLAAALHVENACGLAPCLREESVQGLSILNGEVLLRDVPGLGVNVASDQRDDAAVANDPYAIPHPVESNAQARPSHVAVEYDGRRTDWRTLCDRVRRAATALLCLGIKPGDAVAIAASRGDSLVRDLHAVGWVGALQSVPTVAETTVAITDASALLEPAAERFWPLDEPRIRLTTSGTTGAPKIVDITTGQLVFSAFGSAIRLEHHRDDCWLCCLPLHHVGGLSVAYRTAFYATTMLLHDGFDPDRVHAVLASGAATQVSLVPTMLRRLLERSDGTPFHDNLRLVLLGGAPADDELLAAAATAGVPVAVTYGMTETASQAATSRPGVVRPAGQIGPPLPFFRISTHDSCLVVQGPAARGLVRSSDRGFAKRGVIQVLGRADDVIQSGGELIDPVRVERALEAHPDVLEAAVIGVPDTDWGQRVEAAVVSDHENIESLREWCRERLERFEVPKQIHFVEGIPRGVLGKVSRASVREAMANIEEHANGRARADA